MIERNCGYCGKAFSAKANEVAKGNARYCSRLCGRRARGGRLTRNCAICGNVFTLPASRARLGMAKWCSIACRTAGQTRELTDRFWENVDRSGDCWVWKGKTFGWGYGKISSGKRGGKLLMAHRVSWEIHFGPIPDGLRVLHRCDNPPCVNPDHLFLGTLSDNTQDMLVKGRDRWSKWPNGRKV